MTLHIRNTSIDLTNKNYFKFVYKKQKDETTEEYIVYPFENHLTYFIGYVRGQGVRRFIKNRIQSIELNDVIR